LGEDFGKQQMTLPDERYRAVVQTRRFLLDLTNPKHTPGVSTLIRETAHSMLRHYPSDYDMKEAADKLPEIFAERMEPLYRMVKQYDIEKKEKNEGRT